MKQTLSILTAVFAIFAFFVACGGSEEDDNGSGGIYGYVTDYETGEYVVNANVRLRQTGDTILTDSYGMFEFKDLVSGDYSITVSKAGYSDFIDDFVITVRDRMVRRDVQIVNTECKEGYFFNGLQCVNPCDNKPCGNNVACEATGAETYNCNCSDGYWDGSKCDEFPPCDTKNITPCRDRDTNYIWSARARQDMDWDSAMAYCDNLSEGDFDDWSLPPKEVLANFYNGNGSSKLGDTGILWSSTFDGSNDGIAYCVDFSGGGGDLDLKSNAYSVRCVRW